MDGSTWSMDRWRRHGRGRSTCLVCVCTYRQARGQVNLCARAGPGACLINVPRAADSSCVLTKWCVCARAREIEILGTVGESMRGDAATVFCWPWPGCVPACRTMDPSVHRRRETE